jgi:hypothetical protein
MRNRSIIPTQYALNVNTHSSSVHVSIQFGKHFNKHKARCTLFYKHFNSFARVAVWTELLIYWNPGVRSIYNY